MQRQIGESIRRYYLLIEIKVQEINYNLILKSSMKISINELIKKYKSDDID